MNLSQLHYFKKLVEVNHFSRAAKELYISQPTLSGAIASLEKELEVQLFERDGRQVRLTEYGSVFYGYVCAALEEIDEGIEAVKNRKADVGGSVRLGATITVQDDYLPALLRDFLDIVGKSVRFKSYQGFTGELIDRLNADTLDVAFCGIRDNEPDIEFYPVAAHELKLCVRADHPFAACDEVDLAALAGMELCSYRESVPIGKRVAQLLGKYGIKGVSQVYDDDMSMGSFVSFSSGDVGALMLDSLGVKLFPNVRMVRVKEVPQQFWWVYLAYHKKHVRSMAADRFIEFVRSYPENDVPLGEIDRGGA